MALSPENITSRIVTTRQECYRSVKSDPRRSLHILPEEFQFCTAAQTMTTSTIQNKSSTSGGQFGQCWAKVHYGLCSGFESFVVETTGSTSGDINSPTGRITYTVTSKTPTNFSVIPPETQGLLDVKNIPSDKSYVRNNAKPEGVSGDSNVKRAKPDLRLPLNNAVQSNHFDWNTMPMSPRSMRERIHSAREDIRQAMELLQDDPGTPSDDLQSYIRYVLFQSFVLAH